MSETNDTTENGLAQVEIPPREIETLAVRCKGDDLVEVRFSDNRESISGSLILSPHQAETLAQDIEQELEHR
jgi:hypothetical protein